MAKSEHESRYQSVSMINWSGENVFKYPNELHIRDESWKRIKRYSLEGRYDNLWGQYHIGIVIFYWIIDIWDMIDIPDIIGQRLENNCIPILLRFATRRDSKAD